MSPQMDAAMRTLSSMGQEGGDALEFDSLAGSDNPYLLFLYAGLVYGAYATARIDGARAHAKLAACFGVLERHVPPPAAVRSVSAPVSMDSNDDDDHDEPLAARPPDFACLVRRASQMAASMHALRDDAIRRCTELQHHLATVLRQSRDREERAHAQRDDAARQCEALRAQLAQAVRERDEAASEAAHLRRAWLDVQHARSSAFDVNEEVGRLRREQANLQHTIDQLRAERLPDAVAKLSNHVNELKRAKQALIDQLALVHVEREELRRYRELHYDPRCAPATIFEF